MRRIVPHSALVGLALMTIAVTPAEAQEHDAIASQPSAQVHVAIGPAMAGIHRENGWDSQFGGELHVVRLTTRSRLAAIGSAFGVLTFAETDATRLYVDFYVGLGLTPDLTAGVAVAPVVDLAPNHRAVGGVRATLWLHAGVAPYVSASRVWGLGTRGTIDVAAGLRIPFSVARF